MRRANSITCQFSRSRFIKMAKEIGRFNGSIKQCTFSGSTVVNDSRHHQMSQIICLEIQTVGKSPFLIFISYFRTDHRLPMRLRMRIDSLVPFFDNHRSMDIPISTLCFHNGSDHMIHQLVQFRIFIDGIYGSYPFQPFIQIAIVKRWSPMLTFACSGSYLKITKAMTYIRIIPCIPHTLQTRMAKHPETFFPKTVCPFRRIERDIGNTCIFTFAHVYQTGALSESTGCQYASTKQCSP